MFYLEIPIKKDQEIGEEILNYFNTNKSPLKKEDLHNLIRSHQVYFDNKPVGFLPFKSYKNAKAQIYLNLGSWVLTKKNILFEDEWLIVVNKPSGLASQASLTFLQDHIFSSVMCYLRNKKPFKNPQLFLLHRLDMDTSGVLLMSKKSSINKGVQDLFEKKQIEKTYLAVSSADAEPLPKKVISYLGRKPDHKHKFKFGSFPKDHKGAKYSETHFKLLETKNNLNLYEVSPQTGRSHQIRVHMAENNHAILGDPFYGPPSKQKLHLHAKSLKFTHPQTKKEIYIEAPLPDHWIL